MSKILLNLNLSSHLLLNLVLHDLGLIKSLQSKNEFGRFFRPDHVNATELALAEWSTNFKRVEVP